MADRLKIEGNFLVVFEDGKQEPAIYFCEERFLAGDEVGEQADYKNDHQDDEGPLGSTDLSKAAQATSRIRIYDGDQSIEHYDSLPKLIRGSTNT